MKKLLVAVVVSLVCCMSCGGDDGGSGGGPVGSPPRIAQLDCDPSSATVDEGFGAVMVACGVEFEDPDMDLEWILVRFHQDCGVGQTNEVPKNVVSQTAGRTQGDDLVFDFIAETNCDPGTYDYEILAEDSEDTKSNTLVLPFTLTAP